MEKINKLTPADEVAVTNLRRIWDSAKDKNKSLTQEAAALDLGMTQGAVSQYLLGKTPLGVEATLKWARLLNVNPVEIRPDLAGLLQNVMLSEKDLLLSMTKDLPPGISRDILEHILFKIDRADANIARDSLSKYMVTINKMLDNLKKRKNNNDPQDQ